MSYDFKYWALYDSPKWVRKSMGRLDRLIWKYRYRYVKRHQYNIVRTDLSPGYYDVDHIMEAAMVKLLRRYVEIEYDGRDNLQAHVDSLRSMAVAPAEGREFEVPMLESQSDRDTEVLAIYDWFCKEEPARREAEVALLHQWRHATKGHDWFTAVEGEAYKMFTSPTKGRDISDERMALEKATDEMTDEMLVRLVKIRKSMWT